MIGPRAELQAGPRPAAGPAELERELAEDVRRGLLRAPKELQAKYFYDALGSHLFEAICHLPWYRITSGERRLLARFAEAMVEPLADLAAMVELGCGNGTKIAMLADGLRRRGRPVRVHLIDISPTALGLSAHSLAPLPHVTVTAHHGTYEDGLRDALLTRPSRGSVLVLFLGSNIGNFHPPEASALLRDVRLVLRPGDGLLLGADLVKPEPELLLAYDDPLGLTAAFNKNLLVRINREIDANFDLAAFDHRAVWNGAASRVEMHLVSRRAQEIRIPAANLTVRLAAGEAIWTESSYKYTPEGIVALGSATGFHCHQQWIEPDARFAASLFIAQ